jgi:hypothetical protein
MKNTHTPGPWRTVINMDQSSLRDILASGDSNGIFISSNANESNARLIAAAPELLTALEKMRDYVFSMEAKQNIVSSVYLNACEVIIKAKGDAK